MSLGGLYPSDLPCPLGTPFSMLLLNVCVRRTFSTLALARCTSGSMRRSSVGRVTSTSTEPSGAPVSGDTSTMAVSSMDSSILASMQWCSSSARTEWGTAPGSLPWLRTTERHVHERRADVRPAYCHSRGNRLRYTGMD